MRNTKIYIIAILLLSNFVHAEWQNLGYWTWDDETSQNWSTFASGGGASEPDFSGKNFRSSSENQAEIVYGTDISSSNLPEINFSLTFGGNYVNIGITNFSSTTGDWNKQYCIRLRDDNNVIDFLWNTSATNIQQCAYTFSATNYQISWIILENLSSIVYVNGVAACTISDITNGYGWNNESTNITLFSRNSGHIFDNVSIQKTYTVTTTTTTTTTTTSSTTTTTFPLTFNQTYYFNVSSLNSYDAYQIKFKIVYNNTMLDDLSDVKFLNIEGQPLPFYRDQTENQSYADFYVLSPLNVGNTSIQAFWDGISEEGNITLVSESVAFDYENISELNWVFDRRGGCTSNQTCDINRSTEHAYRGTYSFRQYDNDEAGSSSFSHQYASAKNNSLLNYSFGGDTGWRIVYKWYTNETATEARSWHEIDNGTYVLPSEPIDDIVGRIDVNTLDDPVRFVYNIQSDVYNNLEPDIYFRSNFWNSVEMTFIENTTNIYFWNGTTTGNYSDDARQRNDMSSFDGDFHATFSLSVQTFFTDNEIVMKYDSSVSYVYLEEPFVFSTTTTTTTTTTEETTTTTTEEPTTTTTEETTTTTNTYSYSSINQLASFVEDIITIFPKIITIVLLFNIILIIVIIYNKNIR